MQRFELSDLCYCLFYCWTMYRSLPITHSLRRIIYHYSIFIVYPSSSSTCTASNANTNTGGSVVITPCSGGTPFTTNYSLVLQNWVDQDGGALTYSVSYIKPSPYPNTPVTISNLSSNTQFYFILPSVSTVSILVSMADQYECLTNITTTVTLNVDSSSLTNGISLLQQATSFSGTSLATASEGGINSLIDQITMANQLLLCDKDLNTGTCNSATAATKSTCQSTLDCSNQGSCLKNFCNCSSGYFLRDCSLSQADYDKELQLQKSLITQATNVISSSSAITSEKLNDMLRLINAVTQNPYLNSNETLSLALSALDKTMDVMSSMIKSNGSANLDSTFQSTANIISSAFDQISQLDCGIYNNFTAQALNSTYEHLQELSDISLESRMASSSSLQTGISTNAFIMFSGIYNSSQLNNLVINATADTPQLQLGNVQNTGSLPPTVALTYIYAKKDPLSCDDSTPATNFTLQFKDPSNWQPIDVSASIQVTYPSKIFTNLKCLAACSQSQDSKGNIGCSCPEISIFDMKNQLGRLYNNSNLSLLTFKNIIDIFKAPLYLQWSFWVIVVGTLWLIATFIAVKTCNKDYNLIEVAKLPGALPQGFGTLCSSFSVAHPLLNIYLFASTGSISKGFRALLYHARIMALLGSSAIFMKKQVTISI